MLLCKISAGDRLGSWSLAKPVGDLVWGLLLAVLSAFVHWCKLIGFGLFGDLRRAFLLRAVEFSFCCCTSLEVPALSYALSGRGC